MLKKKLIKVFIFFLLFTFNSNVKINSQLISYSDTYASLELYKSIYNIENELLKDAEDKLLSIITKHKNISVNDLSKFAIANIDLQNGNYIMALKDIDIFTIERHNSPFVSSALLLAGYIELEQENYNNAAQYFIKTLNKVNDDKQRKDTLFYKLIEHSATYWLAISLSHQGNYFEATKYFTKCYQDFSDGEYSPFSLYALGTIEEINHEYSKAINYYNQLQENFKYSCLSTASMVRSANDALLLRNPHQATYFITRAENILSIIETNDSLSKIYEPQVYIDNTKENIIYLKGEICNQLGNYKQTINILQNFNNTYPNSTLINHVNMALGYAYLNLDDFKQAQYYYEQVSQNNSIDLKTKSLANLFRATCYKKLNQVQEAQTLLSTLSVEPNYPYLSQVLLELSQIYYEQKDYDLARRTLERADREVDNAKTQIRIISLLAASYFELKQYPKAISYYQKVEQLSKTVSDIIVPNKNWYLNEARLKSSIALVLTQRSAEAIPTLLAYLAETQDTSKLDEALFWLGEAYYHSDMFKNSEEIYNRVLQNYPDSKRREESYYGRGWSFFREESFVKSSQVFEAMLKEFPQSKYAIEVLTRQGDGFYLVKQYSKAVDCYKRASKLGPNTEDGQYAAYQLAHALYRENKYEQSITALLNFVKNYPKSPFAPNSLYLISWIRFQQGKYAEAIDNFNFLIATYPQSRLIPRAYYAIADCYYNKGDYEEAIIGYKSIVEQFPSSNLAPEAMRSVQYALMALGREEEAIKIADTYIGNNPESPFIEDFHYKKAEMFYTGHKFKDAITEFDNFSKNFPNSEKNAEAYYWMGKSYMSINDFDNSVKYFIKLSDNFPNSDYAALGLLEYALLLKENNLPDTASAILQKILDKYPQHSAAPQAGFEQALLAWGQGDTTKGLAIFNMVAETYKDTDFGDQSRYRIAMYYRMKNNISTAISEFEKIAEVYDNPYISAEARYRIGELYLRDNNIEKATESFELLKDKFAGYEDWYSLGMLSLGEIYEKGKKLDEAREIYLTIIEIRPDDEFGKTAKTRIKRIK